VYIIVVIRIILESECVQTRQNASTIITVIFLGPQHKILIKLLRA